MEHNLVIDENNIIISQEQYEKIRKYIYESQKELISTVKLKDIKGYNFFVKDYQRGYRWTKSEVEDLLSDIEEIDDFEDGYCVQPIIVKKVDSIKSQGKLTSKSKDSKVKIEVEKSTESKCLENTYELLDGQQRLTTLWMILSFLTESPYKIYYELNRDVDCYFIEKAYDTICDWFVNSYDWKNRCPKYNKNVKLRYNKLEHTGNFERTHEVESFIKKINKLFFIWYEVDENVSSEKVFKSINDGKIELTNAELFKALLLNPDNTDEKDKVSMTKLQQIAFEWDKIESGLRDDDFWYFLSKEDVEKSMQKTRIDYIIELYARTINNDQHLGLDENKDRFSFLAIKKYLKKTQRENDFEEIRIIWENIVKVYDKLFSWYKDHELYHLIGYLVACEEKNRGSKAVVSTAVSDLYYECYNKSLDETRIEVRKRIYPQFCEKGALTVDEIKYEYIDKKEPLTSLTQLRNLLLLSNVYSMTYFETEDDDEKEDDDGENESKKLKMRFPFELYNKSSWDIEHVNPRTLEKNIKKCDYDLFKSSMERFCSSFQSDEDKKLYNVETIAKYLESSINAENYKKSQEYSVCCESWAKYADDINQTPDNDITNLVLLNSSINRSYGNAFFSRKRDVIIDNEKKGVFVPICTRNVFTKYYTEKANNLTFWNEEDKKAYGKVLSDMLKEVEGWK